MTFTKYLKSNENNLTTNQKLLNNHVTISPEPKSAVCIKTSSNVTKALF